METFYIEYTIENNYEKPVKKANFGLLILPAKNPFQTIKEQSMCCSDGKESFISPNIFGFDLITHYIDKPFTRFLFKLFATVEVKKLNPFQITTLSPLEEFAIITSVDYQIDNHLFLTSTSLTKMPWNHGIWFPVYRSEQSLFDYLLELNNFIYKLLSYSPQSTNVDTPIEEVLKIKKGVCQDFAHVFISVCRENKIPARYVSGYLIQGDAYIGASQLHAWVEVLIPELGWVGFDATNNLLVDNNYIKIAHGTDYRDCSPIVGVLETAGQQNSKHLVIVKNQQQQ
ncbi:MAG: transglutaminase family protein [Bacteroidales bacterium]|nr:transglutaminase family protein [Bacteroidales bacterium]